MPKSQSRAVVFPTDVSVKVTVNGRVPQAGSMTYCANGPRCARQVAESPIKGASATVAEMVTLSVMAPVGKLPGAVKVTGKERLTLGATVTASGTAARLNQPRPVV